MNVMQVSLWIELFLLAGSLLPLLCLPLEQRHLLLLHALPCRKMQSKKGAMMLDSMCCITDLQNSDRLLVVSHLQPSTWNQN